MLYQLLPLVLQMVKCLGCACCQQSIQIRVKRVDLRLVPIANGNTSLYIGYIYIYIYMIQFLYSCFSSFWSFALGISCFSLFSLFSGSREGFLLIPQFLLLILYYTSQFHWFLFHLFHDLQTPAPGKTHSWGRPIGDNLLRSSFLSLAQISVALQLEQSTWFTKLMLLNQLFIFIPDASL